MRGQQMLLASQEAFKLLHFILPEIPQLQC